MNFGSDLSRFVTDFHLEGTSDFGLGSNQSWSEVWVFGLSWVFDLKISWYASFLFSPSIQYLQKEYSTFKNIHTTLKKKPYQYFVNKAVQGRRAIKNFNRLHAKAIFSRKQRLSSFRTMLILSLFTAILSRANNTFGQHRIVCHLWVRGSLGFNFSLIFRVDILKYF